MRTELSMLVGQYIYFTAEIGRVSTTKSGVPTVELREVDVVSVNAHYQHVWGRENAFSADDEAYLRSQRDIGCARFKGLVYEYRRGRDKTGTVDYGVKHVELVTLVSKPKPKPKPMVKKPSPFARPTR